MNVDLDPADPAAVGAALIAVAERRDGRNVAVTTCERASGGMDNFVWFVALSGEALPAGWDVPLVLRIRPTPDRLDDAMRESAVQSWAVARGVATPVVLWQGGCEEPFGLPVQIAVRAPGRPLIELLGTQPWRAWSRVRAMAGVHARLHDLPTDGWPGLVDGLAPTRLARVRDEVAAFPDPALMRALERVERLDLSVASHGRVVCHGDFHPLNIVSDGESDTVVDWTDASLDDPMGDVARTSLLFHIAAIAASSPAERVLLRLLGPRLGQAYLRAYGRLRPVDHERLRAWEAVHLINGWAQIVGLRTGTIASSATPPPDSVGDFVRARLDRCLADLGV